MNASHYLFLFFASFFLIFSPKDVVCVCVCVCVWLYPYMASDLSKDTWCYIREISGWTRQMYAIYRCCVVKDCRYRHVNRVHYHDVHVLPDQCVSSKHLIGWAGNLEEAQALARHFHDAKYCGKRTYAYLINVYPFPHVVSKQSRGQQRGYIASASYVAPPTLKHQPLQWEARTRPIYVSRAIS